MKHARDCKHCVAVRAVRHGHYHNHRPSPTYVSWSHAIQRCTNPRSNRFSLYGGRGITVCARWRSFDNFLADMGERPEGRTLDRTNGNGDYEPSNCRWATLSEQRRNRRKDKGTVNAY